MVGSGVSAAGRPRSAGDRARLSVGAGRALRGRDTASRDGNGAPVRSGPWSHAVIACSVATIASRIVYGVSPTYGAPANVSTRLSPISTRYQRVSRTEQTPEIFFYFSKKNIFIFRNCTLLNRIFINFLI